MEEFSIATAIFTIVFTPLSAVGGVWLALRQVRSEQAFSLRLGWTRDLYTAILHLEDDLAQGPHQPRVIARDQPSIGERVWELGELRHLFASNEALNALDELFRNQAQIAGEMQNESVDGSALHWAYYRAVQRARFALAKDVRKQLGLGAVRLPAS
jgi:hypothetical protein